MSHIDSSGHLIGNQWITAEGPQFDSISPTDDSVVWRGGSATKSQVEMATAAARKASGPWWDQPLQQRLDLVTRFAEIVKSKTDELARLISNEMGKPFWESKTEVGAVVGKSAVSIEALKERRSESSFELGQFRASTRYKPFGVMGVLGPFNLPAHLPNGHIVPALIAGNTLVFKPSEQTPAVGQWMVEQWMEAGLPPGVLNLVQGDRETAIALANDENLDGLLFTGSSTAGRALHQTYGKWPQKILALEMSGNNPLIVHDVADLRAAAYHTIHSAYITSGQRCTCARRLILVEGAESEEIVEQLLQMIPKVRMGYWHDESPVFAGTVISKAQGVRLLESQEALIAQGAEPLVRSQALLGNAALLSPGLLDTSHLNEPSDDEMFGPILQLTRVKDFDAAIVEANRTSYGLAASLLSDDGAKYKQFIHGIRAGVVNWNRPTTGATGKLPFGGCGISGNNRPSGYFATDYCNWPVASLEAERLEMPETIANGIDL
ncbi:MAG: succinylglutamate-semialdehyde dehydrogenase [Pirellulaceae bacterium]|nr:succinylglutamate-semialdehyde dehydrogenase [Pirellulaceae bacterium]MDG2102830.1 succinylglutamate-semialdehyde dehydrogenase [Pirellulaceae bacterium]